MTTKIELLPLPEGYDKYSPPRLYDGRVFHEGQMRAYARANIARAIAPLQAEIETLRESLAALKAENEKLRKVLKDADNELDWLDEDMDTCDHSVGVCMCDYWNMRRKMKAALEKENSDD